jgi:hypothetical protein
MKMNRCEIHGPWLGNGSCPVCAFTKARILEQENANLKKDLAEANKKLVKMTERPVDTGDCTTCGMYTGYACRIGNDTKRACCCYHTRAGENTAESRFAKVVLELAVLEQAIAEASTFAELKKILDAARKKA